MNSVSDLVRAAHEARADTTILLGAGRYPLTEPLRFAATADVALTNIALRGATHARHDVVIEGSGIVIGNVRGALVADLTFRGLARSAIEVQGETGAERVHVHNVRFEDVRGQVIRATSAADSAYGGVEGGIVEYCDFEYTQVPMDSDGAAAIVVNGGANWLIKYNRFINIRGGPRGRKRFRPAVALRGASSHTHTHNNLFLNCDRGVAYGMEERQDGAADHWGGSIYNNFIYRRRGLPGDAGIMLWGSPETKIYHNTIIQNGTYPRAIEYRYKVTTGLDIRNNLTDGAIAARDNAHATVAANYLQATLGMFRHPRAGDLRLLPTAEQALDRGVPLPGWAFDWDGTTRPFGSRPDIGADEWHAQR